MLHDKIVGLLGGMGPEATIDIFQKIVQATPVVTDADHLRIIIDNNPKMPSRQEAILSGGENPGPAMGKTAQNLEKAGAEVLIICANTAHYFYDDVKNAVQIDVLHIIEETVKETIKRNNEIEKVGVVATAGAMKANIFQTSFAEKEIDVIEIPQKLQEQIQTAIFSYKYNGIKEADINKIEEVISFLIAEGAEAIIMGCTEIPIMLAGKTYAVPVYDPNEIIAKVAVTYAKRV